MRWASGMIASGSFDNSIKLWDAETGEIIIACHLLPKGNWASLRKGRATGYSPNAGRWFCYSRGPARIPVDAFPPAGQNRDV